MSHRWAARVLRLDEVESLPGPGTLRWIPVRHTLGIRAFGCNAYVAAEAGDDVVEPHTESPQAQEELYFVARGAATFTIEGRPMKLPAAPMCSSLTRTRIAMLSPVRRERPCCAAARRRSSPRHGSGPSARPRSCDQTAPARSILNDGFQAHPEDPALLYQLACAEALDGHGPAALNALRRAIAGRPEVDDWARDDADFTSLRDDPAFQALLAP